MLGLHTGARADLRLPGRATRATERQPSPIGMLRIDDLPGTAQHQLEGRAEGDLRRAVRGPEPLRPRLPPRRRDPQRRMAAQALKRGRPEGAGWTGSGRTRSRPCGGGWPRGAVEAVCHGLLHLDTERLAHGAIKGQGVRRSRRGGGGPPDRRRSRLAGEQVIGEGRRHSWRRPGPTATAAWPRPGAGSSVLHPLRGGAGLLAGTDIQRDAEGGAGDQRAGLRAPAGPGGARPSAHPGAARDDDGRPYRRPQPPQGPAHRPAALPAPGSEPAAGGEGAQMGGCIGLRPGPCPARRSRGRPRRGPRTLRGARADPGFPRRAHDWVLSGSARATRGRRGNSAAT